MRILIIDLSNTISVGTHAFPDARRDDGMRVGGIFYTLNKLRTICARNAADAVVAAVDWGFPKWRRDLAPEYKAQRKEKRSEKDEELHQAAIVQRREAWKVLVPCGITCVRARDWEGDDIIAALALKKFKKHDIIVLSSDKDFTQLVSDRVKVYDIYNDKFREFASNYCLKRCLDPKASDNLDGVTRCGPKTADKLVDTWFDENQHKVPPGVEGVQHFIAWCEKRQGDKAAAQVVLEQRIVLRNWKITHMPDVASDCLKAVKYRRGKYERRTAMEACKAFNLRPIVGDFSSFDPLLSALQDPRA